ncbi:MULTISPECIES: hypothetical protein [Bizionia]|uniref:Uncharacterized protein n=1 Tax=Bizionia algoritergicola TaxID=291187 RepID=A0A5D0R132_9FLAO|nr:MULTISPECIES: hypothetical protein [Bizionia]OBX20954.1 hypothetical protein BAA08_14540 [Bizionia sp. APA-3]TYB74596.1 hypothetical protein ES675_00180 [Bizionia algoritergicola]
MAKDRGIQVIDNTDEGVVLDLKINPIRNADNKIVSGLVIGNILEQNKAFILIGQPNDFKDHPTLGVGFEDNLLGEDLLEYRHKIREHFAVDGLKVTQLDLYDINAAKIDANYE